jgi:NADH-quinone oxidoreductase subunit L
MWFLDHAWLIPLIPSVGYAVILLFGKRFPMKGAEVGIGSLAASFVLAVGAVVQWVHRVNEVEGSGGGALGALSALGRSIVPAANTETASYVAPVIHRWTWWQAGDFKFTLGIQVDGLSVTLMFVVTLIAMLIQIYSVEYVRGDRRFTFFFSALTLFAAGMLCMVVAESTVQIILGWEIMGLCSFLLIGHWWEDYANSRAAMKAFLTVRVGDVGLLVGVAALYFSSNSYAHDKLGSDGFSVLAISGWALSGTGTKTALLWCGVALFIACIGKSGQFPLHTWLPDAMAGPTPVSALLHSSTMVVAGVYLVARLYPLFYQGFHVANGDVNLIALIGGITIVIAAVLAFVQVDIKRVLAYSTVSQLGYMMMGLGVGAWTPAVFHIFTHAFFKACLFLGAGSVSHSASHHSFDMKKDMGGLWRKMPITFVTFVISSAALAGIFPLAGFFSKDEIIDNAGHNGYVLFQIVGLLGAFLTAAYMTRCIYLTFLGKPRGASAGEEHVLHGLAAEAHELDEDLVLAEAGTSLPPAGPSAGSVYGDDPDTWEVAGHDSPARIADVHPVDEDEMPVAVARGAHDTGHDPHDAHDSGHDAHVGPHESNWWITVPLIVLGLGAIFAGLLNMAKPVHLEKFTKYVEPAGVVVPDAAARQIATGGSAIIGVSPAPGTSGSEGETSPCGTSAPADGVCFAPELPSAEFRWSAALFSELIVGLGILISGLVCYAFYEREDRRFVGLTERNKLARAGYAFLANKYYLDHLYEGGVVGAVSGPIAKASNWINQHVIDAVVNGLGRGAVVAAESTYDYLDQSLVDGVVNGAGAAAEGTGEALKPVQSGKVSLYAALLFGAAAIGALILVIVV